MSFKLLPGVNPCISSTTYNSLIFLQDGLQILTYHMASTYCSCTRYAMVLHQWLVAVLSNIMLGVHESSGFRLRLRLRLRLQEPDAVSPFSEAQPLRLSYAMQDTVRSCTSTIC